MSWNSFFLVFLAFCKNLGFFSNPQISMVLTTFLHRIDGLLLKYEIIIFRILFKSSDSFSFDHISSRNWSFSYKIWWQNLLSGFFRIYRIFPDFSGLLRIFFKSTASFLMASLMLICIFWNIYYFLAYFFTLFFV